MGKPDPIMELKCALAAVTKSALTIAEAKRGLENQYRDLLLQSDWLKEEIRKAQA